MSGRTCRWPPDLWDEAPNEWISHGNSAIVGPEGELLDGPLREREGILYAELDLAT